MKCQRSSRYRTSWLVRGGHRPARRLLVAQSSPGWRSISPGRWILSGPQSSAAVVESAEESGGAARCQAYYCFVQRGGSWSPRLVSIQYEIGTCGKCWVDRKIAFSFRPAFCLTVGASTLDPRGHQQWPSRGSALVQSSPCSSHPLAVGLGSTWPVARQFIPRKFGALLPAHSCLMPALLAWYSGSRETRFLVGRSVGRKR